MFQPLQQYQPALCRLTSLLCELCTPPPNECDLDCWTPPKTCAVHVTTCTGSASFKAKNARMITNSMIIHNMNHSRTLFALMLLCSVPRLRGLRSRSSLRHIPGSPPRGWCSQCRPRRQSAECSLKVALAALLLFSRLQFSNAPALPLVLRVLQVLAAEATTIYILAKERGKSICRCHMCRPNTK